MHSPVEPIHPPVIHSRARSARLLERAWAEHVRCAAAGEACRVAWLVLGRNARQHGMPLAASGHRTADGAPFVWNAAAPSGLSPAPAELIIGLFPRGRAASACSARDHCALRLGAQRVAP